MTSVVSGGVTAIGYSLLYISGDSGLNYAALFLVVIGTYTLFPCLAAWMSHNSQPYARKATCLALGIISANLGGVISTLVSFLKYTLLAYIPVERANPVQLHSYSPTQMNPIVALESWSTLFGKPFEVHLHMYLPSVARC